MNKYYLVPMWSRQNKYTHNHLALIEAQNRYQAMLIAISSHGHMDVDGNITDEGNYTDWKVDMNYGMYQECKNPEEIFTYMNRGIPIKTNTNT